MHVDACSSDISLKVCILVLFNCFVYEAFFLFDYLSLQASKALKLCSLAAWTRVILLCQMFMHKSNGFVDGISEDAILDFVNEALTQTVFLLDILYQFGISKVKKIIISSLENWSVAEGLFRRLPSPMPLVKQWVKVALKCVQLSSLYFCLFQQFKCYLISR